MRYVRERVYIQWPGHDSRFMWYKLGYAQEGVVLYVFGLVDDDRQHEACRERGKKRGRGEVTWHAVF